MRTYISRDICPHNVRNISFFGIQLWKNTIITSFAYRNNCACGSLRKESFTKQVLRGTTIETDKLTCQTQYPPIKGTIKLFFMSNINQARFQGFSKRRGGRRRACARPSSPRSTPPPSSPRAAPPPPALRRRGWRTLSRGLVVTFGNESGATVLFDCLQLTDVSRKDLKSESN